MRCINAFDTIQNRSQILLRITLINILIKLNTFNISFVPLDIRGYLKEVQMTGFLCVDLFDVKEYFTKICIHMSSQRNE